MAGGNGMAAVTAPAPEPQCLKDLMQQPDSTDGASKISALGRFAGQGHRYAEEFLKLHARSTAVQDLVQAVTAELADAAKVLQVQPFDPIKALQLNGQQDALLAQPALSCPMIGLTQLATAWQIVDDFGLGGLFHLRGLLAAGLVGHSQGVISAVALASARSRPELLKAICSAVTVLWLIGLHADTVEGGMALIEGSGIVRKNLDALVAKFPDLCVAGCNTQHIFVLSGVIPSLEAFKEQLEAGELQGLNGCKFRRLRIEAPFHSKFLTEKVPDIMADAARLDVGFIPLSMPVFTGSGQRLKAKPTVQRLVELVCTEQIDWPGSMSKVGDCTHTVEFGPGAPLPLPCSLRLPALPAPQKLASTSDPPSSAVGAADGVALVGADGSGQDTMQLAKHMDLAAIRTVVLGKLANSLGCQNDEVDRETPFFDLGLRSNDLANFAGEVQDALGMGAVAAHELFDYPTVELLSKRIEQRLAASKQIGSEIAASSNGASGGDNTGPDPDDIPGTIFWLVAKALRCDEEDVEVDVSFFHMGLTMEDLEKMAATLSKRLRMVVDIHEIMDSPTVDRLTTRLESHRNGYANFGAAWALIAPARVDPTFLDLELRAKEEHEMDLGTLIQVQKKLRKRLSRDEVQQELKRVAATCFPDGEAYLSALHSRIMDEEERIYRWCGFQVEDIDALRKRALRITTENIQHTPKLREHSQLLVQLTWPADADRWQW